jgi:MoxR-like ATPase
MQIDVGYPDLDAERKILVATTGVNEEYAKEVLKAQDLLFYQRLVRAVPVGERVLEAILKLVRSARPDSAASKDVRDHVAWGPGPRASQAFSLAVRARALLEGRFAPSIDDVVALAQPVLRHRMALTFAARADGVTMPDVIERLCKPLA